MQSRLFRPKFDRLDARLVLSGDGSTLIAGATLGAQIMPIVDPNSGSSQIDLISTANWYLPGSPPSGTYDPTNISDSYSCLTTN